MRSHNDMPVIAGTLRMLSRQTVPHELIVFDNDSSDGTLEEVKKYTDKVVRVPAGTYVPGRVLNDGMELSRGEFAVFLNSDCTPADEHWLENLLAGFKDERIAGVFGRQLAPAGCSLLVAKDIEETFGNHNRQHRWRQCFSMASSAIRRSVWRKIDFDENLLYSEELDWSHRARRLGYETSYVPDSIVMHAHSYTLEQFCKRQFGEGKAEALIFNWSSWRRSWFRYSFLPYSRQVLSDWLYCCPRLAFTEMIRSSVWRTAQLISRRSGFLVGLRMREHE